MAKHEPELKPALPTSGQVLGALVKKVGIREYNLGSKTASRYFSGRLEHKVKQSSKDEIIDSIATAFVENGLVPTVGLEKLDLPPAETLSRLLKNHVAAWDEFRAFLQPRVAPVEPQHLSVVWAAYVRLMAIDLAIRIAASLRLSELTPESLETFDWASPSSRGQYLNRKRQEVGITLDKLAEEANVSENTVDAWVYGNSRPSDDNVVQIAHAFAARSDKTDPEPIKLELRRFYWLSDTAELLGEYIGPDSVAEIAGRMHKCAVSLHSIIAGEVSTVLDVALLNDLIYFGANSRLAWPFLHQLADYERDDEWKEDLRAAGNNWGRRVLTINHRVKNAAVTALNEDMDGELLKSWDVTNPEAFAHYQRSMELQAQGKTREALAEVEKAAQLDPEDPANHFTIGSVKTGIGVQIGDMAMVGDGLDELWIAVKLDPTWLVPWTEIGLTLIGLGRYDEALAHLREVKGNRDPLDCRYHMALGAAHRELGDYKSALESFETAFHLDPENRTTAFGALESAALAGNKASFRRYAKVAEHLGAPDGLASEWVFESIRKEAGLGRP